MVVEVLRLRVEPTLFGEWRRVDHATWTAFLETRPGFVRKEVWRGTADEIRIVVWWRSREDWDAVTPEQVVEIDSRMGEWFRPSTVESFSVV